MPQNHTEKAWSLWLSLPDSEKERLAALFAEMRARYAEIGILWP